MNANIFKHEFRARLRSVITWSIALFTIFLVLLSIYPSFSKQTALLNETMSQFPPQFLAAFGLTGQDLSTVLGYFSIIFLFSQICLAIQAGNYGFGLVSTEENELTADFLLSKPVSRVQIMNSKLLAAFTGLIITNLVVGICAFVLLTLFRNGNNYDVHTLILLLLSNIIFQLFFLSVGLVISLLVKRVRSVTPYSLGLGFGMYLLNAFSGMLGKVSLEVISPFKHFDPTYITLHGTYDTSLLLLDLAIILASLAASYWLYIRRNIPAVA
jgi:ABC-2 type transport system permease protein